MLLNEFQNSCFELKIGSEDDILHLNLLQNSQPFIQGHGSVKTHLSIIICIFISDVNCKKI